MQRVREKKWPRIISGKNRGSGVNKSENVHAKTDELKRVYKNP